MPHTKDLGLDVAAWQPFHDGRSGHLHFLGQCATGHDWSKKLKDFDLEQWSEIMGWASKPVRFVAHPFFVFDDAQMRNYSKQGGLIYDRPRLVEIEKQHPLSEERNQEILDTIAALYD